MQMSRNIFEITASPEPNTKYCKIGRVHCFFFNNQGCPRLTLGPHCNKYTGPLVGISL